MGLFSFLRKSKKETISTEGEFHSRAEEESNAIRGRGKRNPVGAGKQAGEAVDPVLPEKKRARRRLVGAIALVLAVIIFLPMILDSVPKPVSGDIEIQIPSKDKAFPAGKPQVASVPYVAASPMPDPKIDPVPAVTGVEKPAQPVIADVAASKEKKDDIKSSEAAAVGNAVQVEHKTESKATAKAVPKPESDAKPKPDTKLQAASVSATAAKQPQAKPSDNAEAAARATALLEGTTVEKPEMKAAEPKVPAEKKSVQSVQFVLQVAALASKEKVSELQNKLLGAGIKSYTQKVATKSGERIRVRIGPLAGKEEAERVRAKLTKLGLNGTLVPA